MDYDHDNARLCVVNEDRLSSLPDDLIHQILSFINIKFVVQTCLLSRRWKLLWKSIHCLKFSSSKFDCLPKFDKFVSNVLTYRNHQVEVSSVKLELCGEASQVFVSNIIEYAFSHNVQKLYADSRSGMYLLNFATCLFSSRSLEHFTLYSPFLAPCLIHKTPWDFPALTTLHLSYIKICNNNTRDSVDLFSKCVNLKNLTLEHFFIDSVEVFDIITPRLYNLMICGGRCSKVLNVIAPQLESLMMISCSIKYLNAPTGISTLYYIDSRPPQLPKNRFHSLVHVLVYFNFNRSDMTYTYKEEDARETINMLQELHSAEFLTLNLDIVECLSSFPDFLSHLPSPFSKLRYLYINSFMREVTYEVEMSTEARDFLLKNSPNAKLIMHLPKVVSSE